MTAYEKAIKLGRRLLSLRRMIPLAVIGVSVAAVLLYRPFLLIHNSFVLTAICSALAAAALALRAAAGDGWDGKATGVYSVMRFPGISAGLMMIFSVTLYTGALWFALVAAMTAFPLAHCMVFAREHSLEARHGEAFRHWCRTTGALTPHLINWKPGEGKPGVIMMIIKQMPAATMMAAGFCAINFFNNLAVDFSPSVDAGWLAVLAATAVLTVCSRLLKWI